MAALGVSFGLVACVLGLVLGLCFAHEFLVSGKARAGTWPGPAPPALPLPPPFPGALRAQLRPSCLDDSLPGASPSNLPSQAAGGPQVAVAVPGPKGGNAPSVCAPREC